MMPTKSFRLRVVDLHEESSVFKTTEVTARYVEFPTGNATLRFTVNQDVEIVPKIGDEVDMEVKW